MEIDPSSIARGDLYQHMIRLITPRPIAWVSSLSADGVTNLVPFSYFNAIGSNPPSLMFCPGNRPDGTKKHTLSNIEQTGEFVVNVVSFDLAEQMNQTAASYDDDVSEFGAVGLTEATSTMVKPPRVAEAKAQIECELHSVIHLGAGPGGANVVIGRIVAFSVDDDAVDENGMADPEKMDTVGRMGGITYTRTTERFELNKPKLDR